MSGYGRWIDDSGLPAFALRTGPPPPAWNRVIDPPTRRRWVHLGNRRLTLVADTDGRCGLWDEHKDLRWLTEPEPQGTGVSQVHDGESVLLTSARAEGHDPRIVFGPTYLRVGTESADLAMQRTVTVPEGEDPFVRIQVVVTNRRAESVCWTLSEEWDVRQRVLDYLEIGARTQRPAYEGGETLRLEGPGAVAEGAQGLLRVELPLELGPGQRESVHFRFGLAVASGGHTSTPPIADPELLRRRLPEAAADQAPQAAREIPWHAALLTGGACADGVLGGHTLDQSSAYSFRHGFNGAARDPLQHALPLVHTEPDLALSVLRNTCAWASPEGELPYALDNMKQPRTDLFQPSDQNLWTLWLAAEYAAATGDLAAFAQPAPFHPVHKAEQVPLQEHLRRQFRWFKDVVGTGEHGHVRILNADWNDLALDEAGIDRQTMIDHGESVLNSAMAAWVLPVYAGLAQRLGDLPTAAEARSYGEELRVRVAGEWNGRWFRRALGPGGAQVGEDSLWLEGQPWAILCGAATDVQARQLLSTIDELLRKDAPLGARLHWPPKADGMGGHWYAINATLIWAAARIDPALAWDEWRRMSLSAHTEAYPGLWEGTLSGPDAYLPPESERPGQTWVLPDLGVAMQAWPVANQHSHAQPLLAYLRLLGVEPTRDGRLAVGGGAHFSSRFLTVRPDGSGRLRGNGTLAVTARDGRRYDGQGEVAWGEFTGG
ncbi:GH36-type glycosyl hydrolase domain-containing protein [Streptomyces mesophilus]|uniref:GH36-type glycosyl hydrolase domain-containing protein n=1 Tax=Streptomyces mesophilus TaxID=1775132 RepID=UPI00332390D1